MRSMLRRPVCAIVVSEAASSLLLVSSRAFGGSGLRCSSAVQQAKNGRESTGGNLGKSKKEGAPNEGQEQEHEHTRPRRACCVVNGNVNAVAGGAAVPALLPGLPRPTTAIGMRKQLENRRYQTARGTPATSMLVTMEPLTMTCYKITRVKRMARLAYTHDNIHDRLVGAVQPERVAADTCSKRKQNPKATRCCNKRFTPGPIDEACCASLHAGPESIDPATVASTAR